MLFVPVVDNNQKPLMPTTANRAASWIRSKKATPFWKRGIFCVRLNVEPSARETQTIAVRCFSRKNLIFHRSTRIRLTAFPLRSKVDEYEESH